MSQDRQLFIKKNIFNILIKPTTFYVGAFAFLSFFGIHRSYAQEYGFTYTCNYTAYMCAATPSFNASYNLASQPGNLLIISTTVSGSTSPLQGYGVYLNNRSSSFYDLNIFTTGTDATAVKSTSGSVYFSANNLTIKTIGSNADGINMASDVATKGNAVTYVSGFSDIEISKGIAVRANNFQNSESNAVIILQGGAKISVTGGGNASNQSAATGYAVYAGNRDRDSNGLGGIPTIIGPWNNTLGDSYVFVGGHDSIGNSTEISTTANNGYAVYANKGGLIQLGSDAYVHTSGTNAYTLYAATERQMKNATTAFVDNARPGFIYLEGGVKLRAEKSSIVIQANGIGSIIASKAIETPDLSVNTNGFDGIDKSIAQETSGLFDIVGNISAINGGKVSLNMSDGSDFIGNANSNQDKTNGSAGNINLAIRGANSIWNMTADSIISNLTLDDSILKFQEPNDLTDAALFTPKTLTIADDYHGDGGILQFNTVLGDDASKTDKLVVNGDTSGNTLVRIVNIGGAGDETVNGIEVIHVGGNSDGNFVQEGRIVAGLYDYYLGRGGEGNASNWYLTSALSPEPEPIEPPPTAPPPIDPRPIDPDPSDPLVIDPAPFTPKSVDPQVIRPEPGVYTANLAVANTLFVTRLHDRLGEPEYLDLLTGERKVTSMWLRNEGGHTRFRDDHGQLRTQANRYVMQLGGDILQWTNHDSSRLHLGVMAGYGNSRSNTVSRLSGYDAKGSVTGYSLGTYMTWYADATDKSGLHVDGWLQYAWFNNTVTGQGLAKEEYKSKGLLASLESGYTVNIGKSDSERESIRYFVQPKGQITWMGVKADDHHEANGTLVKSDGQGNIQTRLGIKTFIRVIFDKTQTKEQTFQPFVEINWLHNSKNYSTVMNNAKSQQEGTAHLAELKVGMEIKSHRHLNLWGNIAQQLGDTGYSDTTAMFGVKYNF